MRFTSAHSPNLTFFPKDGNPRRVDWYGDVSFPDRRQSYMQPSVCVAISKVSLGHAETGRRRWQFVHDSRFSDVRASCLVQSLHARVIHVLSPWR